MSYLIDCVSVLAKTPTGEQLYFEIKAHGDTKRLLLQVKPNGSKRRIPSDDQPQYWYEENTTTGILTVHPSFYDASLGNGFRPRENWTTAYQRFSLFGSVEEVLKQIDQKFDLIN